VYRSDTLFRTDSKLLRLSRSSYIVNGDVTKSYRTNYCSKPLLAHVDAGYNNPSVGRSIRTPVDFYNGLSDLPWFDKLFFVWI